MGHALDVGAEQQPTGARPLEPLPSVGEPRLDALARMMAIIARLREPDGCPWDLEQTVGSLAPSLIEEAHEAVEAIETDPDGKVVEELGDLLLVVGLISHVASQEGRFDLGQVASCVGDKLIRRHPHVFGDVEVDGADHAVANWERIKRAERADREEDASALAGLPKAMPALQRAFRLGEKAMAAGFRWSEVPQALDKLGEEVRELEGEVRAEAPNTERVEEELGDVLLSAALLGNYLGVDPERATRRAMRRFEARFRAMESSLGGSLSGASLEAMQSAWEEAKRGLQKGRNSS